MFCEKIANKYFEPRINDQKYPKGSDERADKVDRLGQALQKFIYHLFKWICYYNVYKGQRCLPWFMGGDYRNGEHVWLEYYPCMKFPDHLEDLFGIMIGYYTYNTFDQIVYKMHHPDVWEHILHHQMTILLASMAYFTYYWNIGSNVSYAHDVSDVFVFLFKIVYEVMPFSYGITAYVFMFISYFYTRLFAFPYMLIKYYREFTLPELE